MNKCKHGTPLYLCGICFPKKIDSIDSLRTELAAMTAERDKVLSLGDQLADWINAAGPALKELLDAYERRIRSDCATPEELEKRPWECAEWLQAAKVYKEKPVAVVEFNAAMKELDHE